MSDVKITDGPWKWQRQNGGYYYITGADYQGGGYEVAVLYGQENAANARAIACVPDMIEALQTLMKSYEIIAHKLGYDAELMIPHANARLALQKAGIDATS